MKDYYHRIQDHQKYYEPVEETDYPFIRIKNVGLFNVPPLSISQIMQVGEQIMVNVSENSTCNVRYIVSYANHRTFVDIYK